MDVTKREQHGLLTRSVLWPGVGHCHLCLAETHRQAEEGGTSQWEEEWLGEGVRMKAVGVGGWGQVTRSGVP